MILVNDDIFLVPGNGIVVIQTLLVAAVLVDVQQGYGGGVVLHQPHLRTDRNHPRHGEVEESFGGFFMLAQHVIHHSQKLENAFFPSGVGEARVVDDQVRVDLAVVPTDVESSEEQFVLNILCDKDAAKIIKRNEVYLAAAPCLETISTLGMKR